MNFFYFDQTGHKQGPINEQQLKALALHGTITPQTPLETDAGHKGQAGQIPGLFAAPAPAAPFGANMQQPTQQSVPAPVANDSKGLPKPVVFGGIALLLVFLLVAGIWWMSSSPRFAAEDRPQHSVVESVERSDENLTAEEQKEIDDFSARNRSDVNSVNKDGETPEKSTKENNDTVAVEATPPETTESIDTEQSQINLFRDVFGSDAKAIDEDGTTLLHQACTIGNLTAIKFLVSQGADVNAKKKDGTTSLHIAGGNMATKVLKTFKDDASLVRLVDVNSSAEIVKFLISEGAEVNAKNETGQTPLHSATTHNENIETIKHLVSSGAEVDAKDAEGCTPLCEAIKPNVSAEIVEYLISQGAAVNIRFHNTLKDRQTPLHRAVILGNLEVVKSLVSHGAKLNVKDKQGNTPLHNAIHTKNIDIVKFLISQGADLTVKNYSNATPLAWAKKSDATIAEYLTNPPAPMMASTQLSTELTAEEKAEEEQDEVDYFCSIYKENGNDGMTSLHWAAAFGRGVVVKHLISQGADVNAENKEGHTPLHRSVSRNPNTEIAQLLVSKGADVHARDNDGWTPLHWAATNPNVEVAKFLVLQGADIHAKIPKDGSMPLHLAAREDGCIEVVKFLIANGADIHGKNKEGITPLHRAASSESIEVVKFLVAQGAKVRSSDNDGWTPLHWATLTNKDVKVLKLLISQEAPLNAKTKDGRTPLRCAAMQNPNVEVVRFLVSQGADVQEKNKDGWNLLHNAALLNTNVEVAKFLVSEGVDVRAKTKAGKTPLDHARMKNNTAFIRYLSEF